MREVSHNVDFCVVGGGLAGLCAAVAAAREGLRVVLIQDRPVLGGNASSEIRVWPIGTRGNDNHETGLPEELLLENHYRNPARNWSIWDTVLYEKARYTENLTTLLNCTCNDLTMADGRIQSVRAWQLTTETWHTVRAKLFADCTGDGILAPLSGAEYRVGREAAAEFGELYAPEKADKRVIGQGIILQAREMTTPQPFIAPAWANKYPSDDCFPTDTHDIREGNLWWIEVGNERDTIADAEELKDEALKIALGVWDHFKNQGDHGAENWALDFISFVPNKQESRRYVGAHILTQPEILAATRFEDELVTGGWPMEDHPAEPVLQRGPTLAFHNPPTYFIPLRSLYSVNVDNLLFAGRLVSVSHIVSTSTRVMLTCAAMGQAIGTAAAICAENGLLPGELSGELVEEIRQRMFAADYYLPDHRRRMSPLTRQARLTASEGDPECLRNGVNRDLPGQQNSWRAAKGAWFLFSFDDLTPLTKLQLVFDSQFTRCGDWAVTHPHNMPNHYPLDMEPFRVPETLVKEVRVEAWIGGEFREIARVTDNHQRVLSIPLHVITDRLRVRVCETNGVDEAIVLSADIT